MAFTRHLVSFIGLRYLLAGQFRGRLSFTSFISMAGMTLGVMALVIVLSIFNGSQNLQRERTLITVPHGDIHAEPGFADWRQVRERLREREDIIDAAPYIPLEVLMSQRGYHQVTQVRAIDPALEQGVSPIEDAMLTGRLDALQAGEFGIVIGRSLANNLRLYRGDKVNLVVPQSNAASTSVGLSIHPFTVVGIFDVQFDVGAELAYINLADSDDMLGGRDPGSLMHLRLLTADIDRAAETVAGALQALSAAEPGITYLGEDWSVTQASLFNALRLEKVMTWFMLMMIVAIGAFNIISTLVMAVADKQADIAILRTMGAGRHTILGIFMVQGLSTGLIGVALGAILGIVITLNFATLGGWLEGMLSPGSLYLISELPAILKTSDVMITCVVALLISFLSTLYPAYRAASIEPAQVLRYE